MIPIPENFTFSDSLQVQFPYEVFPTMFQEIVTETHRTLSFPIDFISASMLYAVSVAIGNTHKVEVKTGWLESAVLYLAFVGRPGTNKSHPFKLALKPISDKDNINFQKYVTAKKEYDKIAKLSKTEREKAGIPEPIRPFWEQHLVTDFTPEALTDVHSNNLRGIGVYVDELASWFKNFNRYNKGSEEQFWLSNWSGIPIRINRKTSDPTFIHSPFISVAGTIQPGVLSELAENRTENGFLERLLFVVPDNLKKEYWSEEDLNPKYLDYWKGIMDVLLNLHLSMDASNTVNPLILKLSPEAKKHLYQWQREITDESNRPETEDVAGIYAKLEVYAVRLALCLEMMFYSIGESDKKNIGIEAIKGAIKLIDYFTHSALKVHSLITNTNPIDSLDTKKRTVYNALPEEFTTGEGVEIAKSNGLAERTFKRFLEDIELFEKLERGQYQKRF